VARKRITQLNFGSAQRPWLISLPTRSSAINLLSHSPLITNSPLVLKFEMVEGSNLYQVQSSNQFKEVLSKDLQRVSLLYFWAPWAEPCKQMTEVVAELSRKYPKLL